jgi:hypothetical protein
MLLGLLNVLVKLGSRIETTTQRGLTRRWPVCSRTFSAGEHHMIGSWMPPKHLFWVSTVLWSLELVLERRYHSRSLYLCEIPGTSWYCHFCVKCSGNRSGKFLLTILAFYNQPRIEVWTQHFRRSGSMLEAIFPDNVLSKLATQTQLKTMDLIEAELPGWVLRETVRRRCPQGSGAY